MFWLYTYTLLLACMASAVTAAPTSSKRSLTSEFLITNFTAGKYQLHAPAYYFDFNITTSSEAYPVRCSAEVSGTNVLPEVPFQGCTSNSQVSWSLTTTATDGYQLNVVWEFAASMNLTGHAAISGDDITSLCYQRDCPDKSDLVAQYDGLENLTIGDLVVEAGIR